MPVFYDLLKVRKFRVPLWQELVRYVAIIGDRWGCEISASCLHHAIVRNLHENSPWLLGWLNKLFDIGPVYTRENWKEPKNDGVFNIAVQSTLLGFFPSHLNLNITFIERKVITLYFICKWYCTRHFFVNSLFGCIPSLGIAKCSFSDKHVYIWYRWWIVPEIIRLCEIFLYSLIFFTMREITPFFKMSVFFSCCVTNYN